MKLHKGPKPLSSHEPLKPVPYSVPKCFDRNARLYGLTGAEKLSNSHVMVVGLGGVGSYAAEALARSGVGQLTLIDFDDVCITNVNRQLHALPSTVGKGKSALMGERVKSIAPACQVEAIHAFYEATNSLEILARKPDVIIDAIDNVTAKLHLLATCIYRGIPVVTCLGASAKVDPTRVRYTELRKTHDDPLARAIRKHIWRRYEVNLKRVSGLLAIYSDEDIILPNPDYRSSLCGEECVCPNSSNQHHTCAERNIIYGSAVFVTSMFGMTAASLVARYLAGHDPISLKPVVKTLPGDDPLQDPDTMSSRTLEEPVSMTPDD